MSVLISDFKFELKSDQEFFDFTGKPQTIWNRVVIKDSIFQFFPYMEVNVNDEPGNLADGFVSLEGLICDTKLGYKDSGKNSWLESKWIILDNQLHDHVKQIHMGGKEFIIAFFANNYLYDGIKSRAWKDHPSNIFKDILKKDFKFLDSDFSTKSFITDTNEPNYYYQINKLSSDYLSSYLCKRAQTSKFEYSPFVCFINSAGKAFFCAIDDMLKRGEKISTLPYKLRNDKESDTNPYTIKNPILLNMGMTTNKFNLKRKIYKQGTDAIYINEDADIKNHILKDKGSLLIRKDTQSAQTIFDYKDFGIWDKTNDNSFFKGYRNSFYLNSSLALRLEVQIPFNPKAVSGNVITLEVGSNLKEKNNKASEYSGDWLIIESTQYYDFSAQPTSNLTIAKSRTVVDPVNPFGKKKAYIE